ncbi:MAG: hypothetical protein AABW50_02465 [Nanoarchaeota archaeon]
MTITRVKAPVRIDFAGGTTDIAEFADKYGGAVLNAAINRYVVGELLRTPKKAHLEYTGHTPTSSGLGTSGAMNVVWLALIYKGKSKKELADMAYKLEQTLGNVGGKQDHYAAAFGGISFLEFKEGKVIRTPLKLSHKTIKELESKLVLVYTGIPHTESDANSNMVNNIKKGKHVKNLIRIKELAKEMKIALEKNNLERFAELMNEETYNRAQIHKLTVPPRVIEIIKKGLLHGAIAAKVCGSGNGGSILFFGNKHKLRKVFGNSVIDFKFDFEGLRYF